MTVQEPIEWKMIVQRIIYGKVELDSGGNVYLYLVLGESPYCMYFVNIIFHSTEWHKPKLLTITCVLIWHHLLRWYILTLLADIAMLFMKTHNIPSSCIQILTYLTHTHSKSVLESYFSWTIFFRRSCSFNHHHHYQPPLPVFFWSRCTFSLWPSFSRLAGRDAKIAVLFY